MYVCVTVQHKNIPSQLVSYLYNKVWGHKEGRTYFAAYCIKIILKKENGVHKQSEKKEIHRVQRYTVYLVILAV